MENRRFTAPVEEVEGTVESVSPAGVTLKEYPGLSVLPGTRNLARGRAKRLKLRENCYLRSSPGSFTAAQFQNGTARINAA